MKKAYKAPEMQLLNMETVSVIATSSLNVYSGDDAPTTTIQLGGRKRGADWESYEQ
jgi:hypothetical protein